jgi:hypothetical protein
MKHWIPAKPSLNGLTKKGETEEENFSEERILDLLYKRW